MTYSDLLGFNDSTHDPDWLYYAPLTLQMWISLTKVRQALAQGIDSANIINLWRWVLNLIHSTNLLRVYLSGSSNDGEQPTITPTDLQGYLLIAEKTLEALQERLAIEDESDSSQLWSLWKQLYHSLSALAQGLRLQALGE